MDLDGIPEHRRGQNVIQMFGPKGFLKENENRVKMFFALAPKLFYPIVMRVRRGACHRGNGIPFVGRLAQW